MPERAQQGWGLVDKAPLTTRLDYEGRLPDLLQKLYMQRAVADEAVKLRLDKQPVWAEKLTHAQQQILQGTQNYGGDPNIPPAVMARWQDARQHILWDAYFAQGGRRKSATL